MKISQIKDIIRTAARNNFNILLQGPPGIGKTDIIKQAIMEENMNYHIAHPVTWDSIDARGLPAIVGQQAEFLPFGDLRLMLEAKEPTVIFFDDVGQSAPSVQAAIMQITLERSINGMKISPEVRFMMATNSRKDGAGVAGLLTPLINRFTILHIEPDAIEWVKWGLQNDGNGSTIMPVELLSFMRFKPSMIIDFDPVKSKDSPFASPRSIATLGKWFKAGANKLEKDKQTGKIGLELGTYSIWEGCVGKAFAAEFAAFYIQYNTIAHLPDKIIINPDQVDIPTDPSLIYALTGALSYRANQVNFPQMYRFFERMDKPEFTVAFITDAVVKTPELMNTQTYIKHASNFSNIY